MLSVQVLCVGKLKEKFYIDAVAEYTKRLGGYCKFSVAEFPETTLEKEAPVLLSKLPKGGVTIALCVEGKGLSSEGLAEKIADWTLQGKSQLTFLVGSSYGLHQTVKDAADFCLSMSQMTFPHHLARVMLLEQIYRAFKIQEGSAYHK